MHPALRRSYRLYSPTRPTTVSDDSIVLWGLIVTSKFWSSLCCCLGVKQLRFNPRRRPASEDVPWRAGTDTNWCTPASRLDRLRLSLHLQVLVPASPLSSSTTVTTYASPAKISALVLDSIRNLITACKKNFLHGLDIANPFPPDLWGYVHGFGHQPEGLIAPLAHYNPLKLV